MGCAKRSVGMAILAVGIITTLSIVGCGSDTSATGDDQNATLAHSTFECDLSFGDLTTGDAFKLTLGDQLATVESSDLGKHSGKLAKPAAGDPAGSERY